MVKKKDATMRRWNKAVETADNRLRFSKDDSTPEELFQWLCRLDYRQEARELLEAGRPLGYFAGWTDAAFSR